MIYTNLSRGILFAPSQISWQIKFSSPKISFIKPP